MSQLSEHLSEARVANIPVRVSVELGRFELPLSEAVAMSAGQTVALDQEISEPVNVYVDGLLYGRGQLVNVGGGWSVELQEILVSSKPDFLIETRSQQVESQDEQTDTADLAQ